jgi:hypothetical protein
LKSRNQFNDIVEENSTHIQKLRSLSKQRSIQNVKELLRKNRQSRSPQKD